MNKKTKGKSFKAVVYQRFLMASLAPLFAIEIILLLLYFGINHYVFDSSLETSLSRSRESIYELSRSEASNINLQLQEISRLASILQREHQLFFSSGETFRPPRQRPEFAVAANGVFYKKTPSGASLYYSSQTAIGQEQLNKALFTEALDPGLQSVSEANPNVVAAYFNSWDDMNRLYPYIENVFDVYGKHIHMEDFNFYYLADAKHNPSRNPVWTSAYLDPAGNGWMVSCVVPIYRGDFLEGVTGLDVTLTTFIKNILDLKLPRESSAFVVDHRGMILAMPDRVEKILGLTQLKEHVYRDAITKTIEKPETYNVVSGNTEIGKKLTIFFDQDMRYIELDINDEDYLITQQTIKETGWKLLVLTPLNAVYAPIYEQKQFSDKIGFLAIAFMMLFYALFFIYLLRASKRLADKVVAPVVDITKHIAAFGSTRQPAKLSVNILELDFLVDFSTEIQKANRKYQAINQELQEKNAQLAQLSVTDQLTQVYNRLKLDDVLAKELSRAGRYGNDVSLIMIDVDNFKEVNDTHGHQVGDLILIELARILRENSRRSDTIGRWGGEEFLIIVPNTALQQTVELAEKLRMAIQAFSFPVVGRKTASFGVTSYRSSDTAEDIVERADQALYKAKHDGRNQVASFP